MGYGVVEGNTERERGKRERRKAERSVSRVKKYQLIR